MSFPELQQCKSANRSPLEEIRKCRSKKKKEKENKMPSWVIEGKNEREKQVVKIKGAVSEKQGGGEDGEATCWDRR